jgi:hypothetical protein
MVCRALLSCRSPRPGAPAEVARLRTEICQGVAMHAGRLAAASWWMRRRVGAVFSAGAAAVAWVKRSAGDRTRRRWAAACLVCVAAAPAIHAVLYPLDQLMARVWLAGGPLLLLASVCPSARRRRFAGGVVIVGGFVAGLSLRPPGPLPVLVGAAVVGGALFGVRVDERRVAPVAARLALFAGLTIIVTAVAVIFDAESIYLLRVWLAAIFLWVLAAGGAARGDSQTAALGVLVLVVLDGFSHRLNPDPPTWFFANLAYGAVFAMTVRRIDAATRLLLPIGVLALTVLAAGATFYQREPPNTGGWYPGVAAYIEGTGPGTSRFNRIDELRIDVVGGRCGQASINLAVSWGPPPKDSSPPPRRTAVVASAPRLVETTVLGVRRDVSAKWDEVEAGGLPGDFGSRGWGLVRAVAPPFGGSTRVELPAVDWTAPAGIGSCYLLVPVVLGPEAMDHWEVGRSRLVAGAPAEEALLRPGPVASAHVTVNTEGGSLSVVRGPGTETDSGNQATWACDANRSRQYQGVQAEGCVRAVVLITKSWRRNFEQMMLLVIGALFSVVVELFIRAAANWNHG